MGKSSLGLLSYDLALEVHEYMQSKVQTCWLNDHPFPAWQVAGGNKIRQGVHRRTLLRMAITRLFMFPLDLRRRRDAIK